MIYRHCKLIPEGPIDLYGPEASWRHERVFDPIRPCSLMTVGSGASGGGSGGGGGVSPSATFLIYAMKGGNDGTGTGTDEAPFLTATKALAFAHSLTPSASQWALVLLGPGVFAENVAVPPWVALSSLEGGSTVQLGTGVGAAVTLASAEWIAAGASPSAAVETMTLEGPVSSDFTGINSGTLVLSACTLQGNLTVTGDATTGGTVALEANTLVNGPTLVTGAGLFSFSSGYTNSISIVSTAAQPADFGSNSDTILDVAVLLDASAGQNASAAVLSGFRGTLTLTDGGGGVTSYEGSANSIPPQANITLNGGAAYPVRSTAPNALDVGAAGQVITTQLVGGHLVAVWAAGGGAVTWADDLSTSTNTNQWVSAISGANGLGGAVIVGNNVQLVAAGGGHTSIDMSTANPAFGFVNANRLDAPIVDALAATPLVIGPTSATRIDFLANPYFRMNPSGFFTGNGVNLQVGTLALGAADVGSGQGILALHLAFANPTTVPGATGLLWEDDAGAGLHYVGPSGFGSSFFDEMIAPTWGNNAKNTQLAKRVKIGGFARTVGVGPVNIGPVLDVSVAPSLVNVKFELVGRVAVAGGVATLGDVQAAYTCAAFKNVGGVVTQPTTHALGVLEQQYDPSMNPATVGIVTSPISGTNLQFQVTGVAGATIDWTIEGDAFYN